jgi:hypothetical protein
MATQPSVPHTPRRQTALALSVGLFLFAVYLLSYRGGFHSVDEVSMFAVTESLVKFGRLNTDQIAWTQWTTSQREAQGFFGADGHVYSKKGLALSLAMAPLYALGLVTPGLGMLQVASLANAILTAASAGLLFGLVRRLGYDERVAAGVALLYGLATIAWVYSKYLFSEPLAGLLLLAATYLLVAFRQEEGLWRAALAGLLTGLAVLARANNAFVVLVFGLYLVASSRKATAPDSELPAPNPLLPTSYSLLPIASFLLGLIPPALLLMGYNWVRAGNPFQTGYDLTIFSPNVLLGLYKLLFSPLRGLFTYSPLLVLCLPGFVWLWRRCRAETALALGTAGITLLLFSAWTSGEGLSWGSRFLVPIVPLLCLALAPVLERALSGSKMVAGLLAGLGIVSFAIQFLGIAINPWVYLARLQADLGGQFFLENTSALADFGTMQAVGQLRSWSLANSDVVWWQPWGFDGLVFGATALLLGLSGVNLKYQISSIKRPRPAPACRPGQAGASQPVPAAQAQGGGQTSNVPGPPRPVGQDRLARASLSLRHRPRGAGKRQISNLQSLASNLQSLIPHLCLLLLAILTSFFLLARAYQTDRQFGPPGDGYTQALADVAQRAAPGESVVSVAPYHYHVPMNRFKARMPILGLAQHAGPVPETMLPLLHDAVGGSNAWLVTVGFAPAAPDNVAERWLAFNAFKASDEWLPGDVRLVQYGVADPPATRSLNTTLGDVVRLVKVNTVGSLWPGQTLPAEFVWLPLKQPGADYHLFLQLLTAGGDLVAQHDSSPGGGYAPTSAWSPGTEVSDRHGLSLPADLPPGEYRLIAGLYDPTSGERLSVDRGGDFVEIGRIALQSSQP